MKKLSLVALLTAISMPVLAEETPDTATETTDTPVAMVVAESETAPVAEVVTEETAVNQDAEPAVEEVVTENKKTVFFLVNEHGIGKCHIWSFSDKVVKKIREHKKLRIEK